MMFGRLACDSTMDGAYGVEAAFLLNIAFHCTNCSDYEKRLSLEAGLLNVSNLNPLFDYSVPKEDRDAKWKDFLASDE